MKSMIRIVSSKQPARGKFIPEAACEYFVDEDGKPAMKFRWQGIVFRGDKDVFVFSRDALMVGRVSDKVAKSQARWAGFSSGSGRTVGGGILISLIGGALDAATAKTKNINGIGVFYENREGDAGSFIAVGAPEIIDEIVKSIPADIWVEEEMR